METFYSSEVSSNFQIPETAIPAGVGGNALELSLSHWGGSPVDIDLDISCDGGSTWTYGGGGKGVNSTEGGIVFHFTYQVPPTHVRGSLTSESPVAANMTISAGN